MKNRLQILKEIDKNLTYESIRFNNKQISDELIKSTIDQFFPKLFTHEKYKDLCYFTKVLKDEELYKKFRIMVNMHISIEILLEQIELKLHQKSKIQDSSSHCLQQLNNKKMTRAAVAKRNQLTQEELRKDQIYVRLTPKSQACLQWMLCNRKFPRIQCKLSCNQHIEYLINYLSNKWLPGKGHNRIVLYPDVGSYLKNSLPAKERQKILKEPLNNYFMFTDVMVGCGIGQNGILNLHYDILEKKKDSVRPLSISESLNLPQNSLLDKRSGNLVPQEQIFQINKKVINLDEMGDSNKKSFYLAEKQQKNKAFIEVNHNSRIKCYNEQKGSLEHQMKQDNYQNGMNNNHSNHFLSNQSNLLNPNRSIYHDDESIFKSIGFFAFGNGNSVGFKKNDYNLFSINSNSLMEIQQINSRRQEARTYQLEKSTEKYIRNQINQLKNDSLLQNQKNQQFSNKNKIVHKTPSTLKTQIFQGLQQNKTFKSLSAQTPFKLQAANNLERNDQKIKTGDLKIQEDPDPNGDNSNQMQKHQEKLSNLRNAISLLEQAEGFKGQANHPQEQLSQKSAIKEIKTVSIKKKTAN